MNVALRAFKQHSKIKRKITKAKHTFRTQNPEPLTNIISSFKLPEPMYTYVFVCINYYSIFIIIISFIRTVSFPIVFVSSILFDEKKMNNNSEKLIVFRVMRALDFNNILICFQLHNATQWNSCFQKKKNSLPLCFCQFKKTKCSPLSFFLQSQFFFKSRPTFLQ